MQTLKINNSDIKWKAYVNVREDHVEIYLDEFELERLFAAMAQQYPQEYALYAPQATPARDLSRFSTVCPPGYDTIVGWVAKNRYDIIENLGTAAWLHSRDGFWIANRTRNKGMAVEKVVAPPVLREQGIEQVNAYPVEVIAERFAD